MADEDEPMPEAPKLEPGPQKDEVMALFKTFDVEGTGKIEMKGLKSVKVEVGPSKMSVLEQLAEMDFNGDGFVEEDEWELYFATVVATLDADSLKVILDDLKEAGRCGRAHRASVARPFFSRLRPLTLSARSARARAARTRPSHSASRWHSRTT